MKFLIGAGSFIVASMVAFSAFAEETDALVPPGFPLISYPPLELSSELVFVPSYTQLFVVETTDYRMSVGDVEKFPKSTIFVIWPDSELVDADINFLLATPPTNIMDAYKLEHIVNDNEQYYEKAFDKSQGLFILGAGIMTSNNPLGNAIYRGMANQGKAIVVKSAAVDPSLNHVIKETKVDFTLLDFEIEAGVETVSVAAQWDAINKRASAERPLNVMLAASEEGIEALSQAIAE